MFLSSLAPLSTNKIQKSVKYCGGSNYSLILRKSAKNINT